jgi:prepilin-type N-terminal cleavage/methylation domain-containing protein
MSTGRLVLPALSSANRRRGDRRTGIAPVSNFLPSREFYREARCLSSGFTLIEIMVVILLLAVIVLGLMAMFDQTQRAFRAGMAQTDVMEGGRMFNDLIQREVEQITPSYQNSGLNFYAQIPNYTPLPEALPGDPIPRTNLLQDLFFITKVNQTWNGIGYYVRTNPGYFGAVDPVGTLYRFETNIPVSPFNAGGASNAFQSFTITTNPASLSKILDGVVEFRVHCFDTNGVLLTGNNVGAITNNFVNISNVPAVVPWPPNEMSFYAFSNNIVPAYVEIEVGILEPAMLRRYNSIPNIAARYNFLSNHAGNVELFRQRIAIRNVDPSGYTTNYSPAPF